MQQNILIPRNKKSLQFRNLESSALKNEGNLRFYYLFFVSFFILMFYRSQSWASEVEKSNTFNKNTIQKSEILLQNIRRLVVKQTSTNLAEFKQFALENDIALEGMCSQPLNASEIQKQLTELTLTEGKKTGRYWLAVAENSPELLAKKADADAFLNSEIRFSPEHTSLKLWLTDVKTNSILVREQLLLQAQPSIEQLQQTYEQGLSRISQALGHDGKITSLRSNTAVLNFGSERGLQVGDTVDAGIVVLSEYHPQSGEYLKVENKPLYRLKIVETAIGSSLAELEQKNPVLLGEVSQKYGQAILQKNLLVWLAEQKDFFNTLQPRVKATPQAGQTPTSFEKRPVKENGQPWELPGAPKQADNKNNLSEPSQKQKNSENSNQENSDSDNTEGSENSNSRSSDSSDNLGKPSEAQNEPFVLERFSLGLGATYAILETKRGDRFSDQPPLLLNGAVGYFRAKILGAYHAFGEITLRDYSGGDVTGGETTLYATAYFFPFVETQTDKFLLGATLGSHFGNVKSRFAKKDLFYATLFASVLLENTIPEFGKLETQVSVAPFDLLAGDLAARLKIEGWFTAFLPKQLGIFGIARKGPVQWSAFEFGAHWNLL